jgi:hypothetical protein
MIRNQQFAATIFAACVLTASAGLAQADIVQCIDAEGVETFTDRPCEADADTARAFAPTKTSAVKATVSRRAVQVSAAEKARATTWTNKPATNRGIARDVATMEAARLSMASMDQASALLRQQALLQPKDNAGMRWTFWRAFL